MSQINYDANFNSNDLATVNGLTVLATNPYRAGQRKLTINDIARTNKAKTSSALYNKKAVVVRVGIVRATRDLVEASWDSLMAMIQGREKDLLLRQAGATRKYCCTFSDAVFRVEGGSYIEADLVFETSDHFGYDQNDTLLLQVSGYTSSTKTDILGGSLGIGGSAPWQVPKITLTFTALTGGTSKYVSIGNDATGQTCVITRTWTAGDVIEIDAQAQTVKVNGVEVSFTGAIPEWAPGVGYLTYADNLSSRTFSNTVTYKKRYA